MFSLDGPWSWLDGSDKTIVKWSVDNPANDVQGQLCATMGLTGSDLGIWFSSICSIGKPFVCKKADGEYSPFEVNLFLCFFKVLVMKEVVLRSEMLGFSIEFKDLLCTKLD